MKHGGNVWAGKAPEEWLDFSANLRPEGIYPWIMQEMTDGFKEVCYYPDRSMEAATLGLSKYLCIAKECILPTAGGAQAIDLVLSRKKGRVYVYPITFGEYAERANIHGRDVSVWNGFCNSGDTVMLCNPNNPTGSGISREEILQIFRTIQIQGGELVIDEAFIDYCPDFSVRHDIQPGLIVVGSMTKVLCIPGIRLGYICATDDVIKEMRGRMLPWSLNALAVRIAQALPNHKDEMAEEAEKNKKRRKKFSEQLEKIGADIYPSYSNFLLVNFHQNMDHAAEALKDRKILVRTCASFGLGPEYWRLAVKTEEENTYFIEQLEEVLYAR